jgi:RNA polymerase sigma-70 factor, ECF subfamily
MSEGIPTLSGRFQGSEYGDPVAWLSKVIISGMSGIAAMCDTSDANTDFDLMARLCSGYPDALNLLMDRHGAAVFAFLNRRVSPRETAEDLFQDTWIRVAQRCHTYKAGRPVRPWLYRIAWNVLNDQFRKDNALRRGGDVQHVPLHESDAENVVGTAIVSEAIRKQEQHSLRSAVDALPEIYRDVIRLRYFEELGTAEVAQVLDCAEGTVKSRLARGLAMLHAGLEESK